MEYQLIQGSSGGEGLILGWTGGRPLAGAPSTSRLTLIHIQLHSYTGDASTKGTEGEVFCPRTEQFTEKVGFEQLTFRSLNDEVQRNNCGH